MSVSSFETGEGSVSAERDPSSGAAFVHATFSHKGRREEATPRLCASIRRQGDLVVDQRIERCLDVDLGVDDAGLLQG